MRVSLLALDNKVREQYKSGNQIYVSVRYSIELYTIIKIIKSRSKFAKDKYQVKNNNTGEILDKILFSNELRKVPVDTVENHSISKANIKTINNIKT